MTCLSKLSISYELPFKRDHISNYLPLYVINIDAIHEFLSKFSNSNLLDESNVGDDATSIFLWNWKDKEILTFICSSKKLNLFMKICFLL